MKSPLKEKENSFSISEKMEIKEEKKEEKKGGIPALPVAKTKKYKTVKCNDEMSFEECELTILRSVVDLGTEQEGQNLVQNPDIQKMIRLLEEWLREKGNMCYGGTALNAVLPKNAQFYNRDVEIPDYDFFSPNALQDAIELSQYYYRAGFEMVEAKSGVHHGTFKVYVNFIPLADITQMEPVLYKNMKEDSITIGGIRYAPIHFLRLACFTELSRPKGDISRWEKVFKRLTLLNQYYPLKSSIPCELVEFQRPMTPSSVSKASKRGKTPEEKEEEFETTQKNIYEWTRDALIEQGAVFFGGYATSMYAKHMSAKEREWVKQIPDFDVLCVEAGECAQKVAEDLRVKGVMDVSIQEHEAIGEIVPRHYQIMVFGKETICFVFEPIACHSYNQILSSGKKVNVATIDTMLSLYLAFLYTGKPYFYKERILCMAQYLFEVEQANRLEQKGVLRRFTMECVGKQESLIDIREKKARKFRELKKGTAEYNEWFLRYNPASDKEPLWEKKTDIIGNKKGEVGKKGEKKREKRAIEWNGNNTRKQDKKPVNKKHYKTRRHRKSSSQHPVYFY
jgi:hypothetical protein